MAAIVCPARKRVVDGFQVLEESGGREQVLGQALKHVLGFIWAPVLNRIRSFLYRCPRIRIRNRINLRQGYGGQLCGVQGFVEAVVGVGGMGIAVAVVGVLFFALIGVFRFAFLFVFVFIFVFFVIFLYNIFTTLGTLTPSITPSFTRTITPSLARLITPTLPKFIPTVLRWTRHHRPPLFIHPFLKRPIVPMVKILFGEFHVVFVRRALVDTIHPWKMGTHIVFHQT